MRADQRTPLVDKGLERPDRRILRSDGIVDHVVGYDAVLVEDLLGAADMTHVLDARRMAVMGLAPIEFLFGVDHRSEDRPRFWRKLNELASHLGSEGRQPVTDRGRPAPNIDCSCLQRSAYRF